MLAYEERPLYTNITVDIGRQSNEMVEHFSRSSQESMCATKMRWDEKWHDSID